MKLFSLALLMVGFGWSAQADASETFVCASHDYRYNACAVPSNGRFGQRVIMERQISNTRCVQGRNYGIDHRRNLVWVDKGCSAIFRVLGGGHYPQPPRPTPPPPMRDRVEVMCSSIDHRRSACSIPLRFVNDVFFAQQHSNAACTQGVSWGFDRRANMIWVDKGCRATFIATGRD